MQGSNHNDARNPFLRLRDICHVIIRHLSYGRMTNAVQSHDIYQCLNKPNILHQKIQVITLLYIFASSFIEDKEYRKQRTIKQQEIWN